jgi:hypothetical protein
MARVITLNTGSRMANVSASVGKGGKNHPDDVLLVNNLLRIVNMKQKFTDYSLIPRPGIGSADDLGPVIELFQMSFNIGTIKHTFPIRFNGNPRLNVDGRINPARDHSGYKWKENRPYTILVLNSYAKIIIDDYYDDLAIQLFLRSSPILEELVKP